MLYWHEFEQTPGDGEGQASLVCGSPWGCKELDATEKQQHISYKLYSTYQKLSEIIHRMNMYSVSIWHV